MRVAPIVALVLIAAACGGAAETNLFGDVPEGGAPSTSGTTSGATASSGNVTSSSGTTSGCAGAGCTGSSSSGTVLVDAGPDTGGPNGKCNVNAKQACLPTEYCKVEACNQLGVCAPRPAKESLELTPVCGCDHVTYWNESIAAVRGVSVATMGACGATGTVCTRQTGCTGDAKCNLEVGLCSPAEVKGTCWQPPKSCDGTNSKLVRRCNNAQCMTFCAALDDERSFGPGTGCL